MTQATSDLAAISAQQPSGLADTMRKELAMDRRRPSRFERRRGRRSAALRAGGLRERRVRRRASVPGPVRSSLRTPSRCSTRSTSWPGSTSTTSSTRISRIAYTDSKPVSLAPRVLPGGAAEVRDRRQLPRRHQLHREQLRPDQRPVLCGGPWSDAVRARNLDRIRAGRQHQRSRMTQSSRRRDSWSRTGRRMTCATRSTTTTWTSTTWTR